MLWRRLCNFAAVALRMWDERSRLLRNLEQELALRISKLAVFVASTWLSVSPLAADGLAGSYLAARHASYFSDYEEAALYFTRALSRDPSNASIMENAMTSYVGLGSVKQALPIARRMEQAGVDSQIAAIVITTDQVARGDFESILRDAEAGRQIGPLVDGLIQAWSHVGTGKISQALMDFDDVAAQPGLSAFAKYHKALALALAGDMEGADAVFASEDAAQMRRTRRGALAYVEVLSQLGRNEDAIDVIDNTFGQTLDIGLTKLRARLVAGEPLDFTFLGSAKDGIAEVFYTVGIALDGEAADGYTLIYSRMAEHLRPDHIEAILFSAGLLESLERYELATKTYNKVPRDSDAFHAAELGRAEALRLSEKPDAAVEVLQQLSKSHPQVADVHISTGDLQRQLSEYGEAADAYTKAIEIFGDPRPEHWFVYYTRGIAYERMGEWPKAEADFRQALDLNPDQPQVLNYLGYSLVEMNAKLDEATDMIERAVAARPDSGYIVDSLGWVLFRTGKFEDAVVHLERAAEIEAVDPIVNDHLGDAYWAVGRKVEATFQWNRALSFDPVEKDADRIRRKLEVGLDVVREEEGEEPFDVANDN